MADIDMRKLVDKGVAAWRITAVPRLIGHSAERGAGIALPNQSLAEDRIDRSGFEVTAAGLQNHEQRVRLGVVAPSGSAK